MLRGRQDRFRDIRRFWEIFTIGLELNSKDHFRSAILAGKYGQTKCTFPFFWQAKITGTFLISISRLRPQSKTSCQISAKSTEWSGRRKFESHILLHLKVPRFTLGLNTKLSLSMCHVETTETVWVQYISCHLQYTSFLFLSNQS